MAKHRNIHCSVFNPVDPLDFYQRLGDALHSPRRYESGSESLTEKALIFDSKLPEFGPEFRDQYLLSEVLRKYPGFNLGIDTVKVALNSFKEDEHLNCLTNARLQGTVGGNPLVGKALALASRKIGAVLGEFRWDWWQEGCRFGPGATTRLRSETALPARKLSGTPHCSLSASALAESLISVTPSWAYRIMDHGNGSIPLEIVDYDKLCVVPKNAKTGRTIGIPPDMNIYMQLGMGYSMRRKMSRWGINLNDQSINQSRAKLASEKGELATLDMKSASNSISKGLVHYLFGKSSHSVMDPTWYKMLLALRTDGALIDNETHTYELFSAMGNGYTFELESLIFWALSCAVCESLEIPADVTVYGDDIICPVSCVEQLITVFEAVGFRINSDKSFWNSGEYRFRESCGKHFLNGVDVTPFYIDTELNSPDQIVLLANNLIRWSQNFGTSDARLRPVIDWVIAHLPAELLSCRIPFGDDDDGLISSFDEAAPSVVTSLASYPRAIKGDLPNRNTFYGYRVRVFTYAHRKTSLTGAAGYVTSLYNTSYTRFGIKGKYWFENIKNVNDLSFPSSRKKELVVKTRVVMAWREPGMWV